MSSRRPPGPEPDAPVRTAAPGGQHDDVAHATAGAVARLSVEFPAQRAIAVELPEEHFQAVLAETEAAFGQFAVADGVDLPGEVLVVVGTR